MRKAIFTVSPFPASTLLFPNEFSFPNDTLEESFREFVPEYSAVCNDIGSSRRGQPPLPLLITLSRCRAFLFAGHGTRVNVMLAAYGGHRVLINIDQFSTITLFTFIVGH
jgi:hypothetical protein